MSLLIPLSRAAKLVGVKRRAIQLKIQKGQLSTFEGMIDTDELMRAYPKIELDHSAMVERSQHIIDLSVQNISEQGHKIPEDTLLSRITRISSVLAVTKNELKQANTLIDECKEQLQKRCKHADINSLSEFKNWFDDYISAFAYRDTPPNNDIDTLLTLLNARVEFTPSRHHFLLEGSENLLDSGLRAGLNLPYQCSDGSCNQCLAKINKGQTKQIKHWKMASTLETEHHIRLCCHTAVTDLILDIEEVVAPEKIKKQSLDLLIKVINKPNPETLLIEAISMDEKRLHFLSGQKVTLTYHNSATTVAIANCPCEEKILQFHLEADSEVSKAILAADQTDIVIQLSGPVGQFILDNEATKPLLFIAHENHYGAVKSLVQHAISRDIVPTVSLYWVASKHSGHYEHNLCRAWNDAFSHFNYLPIIENKDSLPPLNQLLQNHPELTDYTIYIAGSAIWTKQAKQYLKAAGAQTLIST